MWHACAFATQAFWKSAKSAWPFSREIRGISRSKLNGRLWPAERDLFKNAIKSGLINRREVLGCVNFLYGVHMVKIMYGVYMESTFKADKRVLWT